MKKRLLALLLCALMVVGTVPCAPLADYFVMEAAAADIEALQTVFNKVPDPSTWDQYINTSALKIAYEYAALVLEKHENFDQSDVDACTESLQDALDGLQYHTKDIALNKQTHSAAVGETFTLRAILTPADAADSVEWSSSNSTVASVTQNGVVTVNKYSSSKVTITATSNGHSASCALTVLNPLGGVKLSKSSAELYEGKQITLTASAYGIDSSNKPTGDVFYTWSTDDEAVATVSDSGVVTAVAPGSCVITVTATDNKKVYTAKCNITVEKMVLVSGLQPITITTDGTFVMTALESKNFRVTVLPSNASIKTLTWKSSNTSVASLSDATTSESGIASVKINALKEGKATITYTTTDGSGKSGSFTVDVRPLISSVALSPSSKVITVDSVGEKFTAVIKPSNAGNQVLSWSSDNPKVCEVDYNGTLVPHAAGTATITAATSDGSNIVVSGKVRVAAKASTIAISRETLSLAVPKTYTLSATVTTLDGETYGDVQWTSSDTKIVTVSQSGVVTAKYPGSAVITATAIDGTGKSAVCVVTVTQPVKGVSLPTSKGVYVGKTFTLTPTFEPSYATNKKVTWSSSDSDIADVDSNGKVTGKKVGKATITCKTSDGGYKASCVVTVSVQTTGVTLNKTSAKIWKGATVQLTPTVTPSNATDKSVSWSTSNSSVAVVDSNGLVRGVAGGTATITVKTSNGGFTASCKVTVLESCTGVTVEKSKMSMYLGQTYKLTATVLPSTATNKDVTWSSSNSAVVKVASDGTLSALKLGTATVTVKTADGGFTASCSVTVTNKVPVTGVTLDTTSKTIAVGKYYTFMATISPSNASERGLVWSSSNSKVVYINESGKIKARKPGTAIITVTTVDGNYQKQCKVTVVQPVEGVRINASSVNLALGKSKTLVANVFPSDATNKAVTWKSSNKSVVTVSSKGVVTAKGAGNATITATTSDGGYTSTCNFTVYVPVTGVKISASKVDIPKTETRLLTASVLPSNASNQGITWKSSNTAVATVNEAGQITARSKGTANITATSKDGGYTATCVVQVIQYATGVKLNYSSVTLDVGKTKTLTATLSPSTVTYKTVKWKSSNTSVAKISSKGVITAVKAGTATITCTSKDGKVKTTCKVTVNQPATGISLQYKSMNVREGQLRALKATVKPADVTNAKVIWSTSNKKIATVDSNGVVKGIKPGTVTITATTVSGNKTAKCKVKVIRSVTGISLNKTSMTINVGKSSVITPKIKPSDASIKTVTWTSNNNDVATVTKDGKVVAKAPGYAVITAKTKDKGKTAKCQVLVIQPVTGVKLNKSSLLVEAGEKYTLKPTVSPSNASDKDVKWSTSNKKIAKISSSGVVTGVKSGTVTITCTTVNGGYKAKCTVRVVKKVKDVEMDHKSATVYLGKTFDLDAIITPSDATVKTVKWYSGDKKIAKVNQNGLVTPVKPGKVTIGVKTTDGGFKAYCKITVKKAVTSIKLDKSSATLYTGKTLTLKPTIKPSDATDKTLKWTTSSSKIATVSSKGVIKAVAPGTATITATTENGLKYKCKVTVRQSVTGVDINKNIATVYAGEKLTLKASVLPSNAYNQAVTWSTANSAIAKVSTSGVVTGVKAGKTTVTVKTADGSFKASCEVTVLQHVTSIKLDKTALSMRKGDEADLKVTVSPSDASDKSYTFVSSNPETLFVTATGHIIAKLGGEATITVKSNENKKTATCRVTVIEPVTAVALDKEETTIFVGDKFTLGVVVSPTDANNKTVMWTSSDPSVATVSSTGVVTAMKSGEAVITVTTNDGGFKDSCTVTCLQKPTSVKLSESAVTVNTGKQHTLTWTVLPEDSFNKDVTWESDDESIATVDNGVITAINPGKANITVKTVEGGITALCEVTVHEPVQKIELDKADATLNKGEELQLSASIYPSNASNQNVTWQTSDETVATVSEGLVTATGKGTAYITVTAQDGGLTAVCKLTVRQLPEEILFGEKQYSVATKETLALTWTVLPENSNDKNVTFTSDNEEVATVDENGVVTGIKAGEALITAKATDGGIEGSVKLTVIQKAESISVTASSTDIWVGETEALTAEVLPFDTTDKSVTWKSSDEAVATVDENGVVTGIKAGTCDIITASVYGTAEGRLTVTVLQQITSVELSRTDKAMKIGESFTLTATVLPEDAYNRAVTWESSDEAVAEVDENGVVTAKKLGTATITAISADSSIRAECEVRVIKLVDSITFEESSIIIEKGKTATLTPVILPEDATEKQLTWVSDNEDVVTVDENGVVTGVNGGKAKVKAITTTDGVFAECEVTVDVRSTAIALDKTKATIYCGDRLVIKAEFTPADTTNKNVIWSSSDEEIATVENGVVTAVDSGTVTITAKAEDTGVEAECVITVNKHVSEVNILSDSLVLEKGTEATLIAKVLPEDATDKSLTWESSNTKAVKVENGTVSAVGTGTAVITATSTDGGLSDTCEITVIQKPESITISKTELTLVEEETAQLSVSYGPSDVTETETEWSSSDNDVATVDKNGVVTAVSKGTAEIIATSKANPSIKAKCLVTVTRAVKSISMKETSKAVYVDRGFSLEVIFNPVDATNQKLIWSTSDKTVAQVDDKGNVTPVDTGSVIITAESVDGGYVAYCRVTVKRGIDSVAFDKTEITLSKKESASIKVSILPEDATEKDLIWTSTDEAIAKVVDGTVTAGEKSGIATIRATAPDNDKAYAECKVTVKEPVTNIELSETELSLKKGDTETLRAFITPDNATVKDITWKSTDEKVVTVSDKGELKAIGAGTAKIICTSVDSGKYAICDIKVLREIESLSASLPAISIKTGASLPLTVTAEPSQHDEKFSFASSNEDVLTVDDKGNVTAKKAGTATVTVISDVSGTKATCEITVVQSVEGISFSVGETAQAYTGLSHKLAYSVSPADATDKAVRWLSSDESIATVTQDGLITYHAAGEVIITVQSLESEVYAQCKVTVNQSPEDVQISTASIVLKIGGEVSLSAEVTPDNAYDKTLTWVSDKPEIAKVDANGKVTGVSKGSAVITVRTFNGLEAFCLVEVIE